MCACVQGGLCCKKESSSSQCCCQQLFNLQVTDEWQLWHQCPYLTREKNEPPTRECSYYKVGLQDIRPGPYTTHACRSCQNRDVAAGPIVQVRLVYTVTTNVLALGRPVILLSLDVYVVAKADSQLLKANTEDGRFTCSATTERRTGCRDT